MSNDTLTNGGRSHPASGDLSGRLTALENLDAASLRAEGRQLYRSHPPKRAGRDLLARAIAYKLQERALGGLSATTKRKLRAFAEQLETGNGTTFDAGIALKPGAKMVREWHGETYAVIALEDGFEFEGRHYRSLSKIAQEITGAHWSGPRFFGLKRAPKLFAEQSVEGGHE